ARAPRGAPGVGRDPQQARATGGAAGAGDRDRGPLDHRPHRRQRVHDAGRPHRPRGDRAGDPVPRTVSDTPALLARRGRGPLRVRGRDDDEIPPDVRAFVVERDLAGLAAAFRGAQIDLGLTAIETTLEPAGAALLGEAWGLSPQLVRPHAASNRLVITPEQLGERLPQADENTARLFEKQCREVLDVRMARVGVAGQVRSRLRHERAEWPSMAAVAADLHL